MTSNDDLDAMHRHANARMQERRLDVFAPRAAVRAPEIDIDLAREVRWREAADIRAEVAEAAIIRIRRFYGLTDHSTCWTERGGLGDGCIACTVADLIRGSSPAPVFQLPPD